MLWPILIMFALIAAPCLLSKADWAPTAVAFAAMLSWNILVNLTISGFCSCLKAGLTNFSWNCPMISAKLPLPWFFIIFIELSTYCDCNLAKSSALRVDSSWPISWVPALISCIFPPPFITLSKAPFWPTISIIASGLLSLDKKSITPRFCPADICCASSIFLRAAEAWSELDANSSKALTDRLICDVSLATSPLARASLVFLGVEVMAWRCASIPWILFFIAVASVNPPESVDTDWSTDLVLSSYETFLFSLSLRSMFPWALIPLDLTALSANAPNTVDSLSDCSAILSMPCCWAWAYSSRPCLATSPAAAKSFINLFAEVNSSSLPPVLLASGLAK